MGVFDNNRRLNAVSILALRMRKNKKRTNAKKERKTSVASLRIKSSLRNVLKCYIVKAMPNIYIEQKFFLRILH